MRSEARRQTQARRDYCYDTRSRGVLLYIGWELGILRTAGRDEK